MNYWLADGVVEYYMKYGPTSSWYGRYPPDLVNKLFMLLLVNVALTAEALMKLVASMQTPTEENDWHWKILRQVVMIRFIQHSVAFITVVVNAVSSNSAHELEILAAVKELKWYGIIVSHFN